MSDLRLKRCKGCGREIEWIEFDGNNIALDPRPTTLHFDHQTLKWKRSSAYVVHNAVCPAREQFTQRTK